MISRPIMNLFYTDKVCGNVVGQIYFFTLIICLSSKTNHKFGFLASANSIDCCKPKEILMICSFLP